MIVFTLAENQITDTGPEVALHSLESVYLSGAWTSGFVTSVHYNNSDVVVVAADAATCRLITVGHSAVRALATP
jgi:hypothetical protein